MKYYIIEHGYQRCYEDTFEIDGVYDEDHVQIAIDRLLKENEDYDRECNIFVSEVKLNERIKK